MNEKKQYPNSPYTNKKLEELKKFWTPERMKAAVVKTVEQNKADTGHDKRKLEQVSGKIPQASLPRPPGLKAEVKDATLDYSATPVPNPTTYPFSSVGKLFYIQNGVPYVASASVVYNNTILTAAHVLYDFRSKLWAQNIMFVPAYQEGMAPLGSWGVVTSYVMPGYLTTGRNDDDIGMATTTPESVANTTGYLGLTVNQGWQDLVWQDLAYPGSPNPPYTGERMWSLTGPSTGLDPNGTIAVGMQSNFATGASGGPWLLGGATVNGLSSYGYPSVPNVEYSPYFDNAVWQMFIDLRT